MKQAIAVAVLLLAAIAARAQVPEEQPGETYWHLVSDSGVPDNYLIYAGLTTDERAKVLPVLAEYDAKYQLLRKNYDDLPGETQVQWAQAEFLVRKDAMAKEYDARITSLLSQRSLLGVQQRIGEVAENMRLANFTADHPMVTPASYRIHAQMNGPQCHPSFHYGSAWAVAVVPPNRTTGTAGSMTLTSSVSGYTYISSNQCNAFHTSYVKAQLDTVTNDSYGGAEATSHLSSSVTATIPIGANGTDPIYSDTGVQFGSGGDVHCPTFGYIVPFFWYVEKIQVEFANTTAQIDTAYPGTNKDGYTFYDASPWSPTVPAGEPSDSPCDFRGADVVFVGIDPTSTGWIRASEFGWRWAPVGGAFTGIGWQFWNSPRIRYIQWDLEDGVPQPPSYPIYGGTDHVGCTLRDHGYFPVF